MPRATGRTYTLRGAFPFQTDDQHAALDPVRLQLWNGSFTDNWVIESVDIVITDINHDERMLSDDMINLVIATRENGAIENFNLPTNIQGATLRDNRQIWWQSMSAYAQPQSALDPDNLLVEDLWINGWYTDQSTGVRYALNQEIGYLITLRATKSTIPQTILTLIKEMAQDSPTHA